VSDPAGHLRTEVPAREPAGSTRTVISAGRDVELGARSMLILAEGLFRLDVVPHEDTIQTIVRSLSDEPRAELRSIDIGGETRVLGGPGDVIATSTGRFGGEVVLVAEDGSERAVAKVLVGSVCHLDRGVTSFTAQATLL
jgi:hypothetical protein